MLNATQLHRDLSSFLDKGSPYFIKFPADNIETARMWSEAVGRYAKLVVPLSVSGEQAQAAFNSVMLGMVLGTAPVIFKSAFSSFAAVLALGMQPNFTGTPPAAPIIFEDLILTTLISSEGFVDKYTLRIDSWFRLGFAVNNASGVTTNWN